MISREFQIIENHHPELLPLLFSAKKGNRIAQQKIADVYSLGMNGMTQDYIEAYKWYHLAAQQGSSHAQYCLGHLFYLGKGVSQNYLKAEKWWLMAAKQGLMVAQASLALLYYCNNGYINDLEKAEKWFKKAADQGDEMSRRISNVIKDIEFTDFWYEVTGEQREGETSEHTC